MSWTSLKGYKTKIKIVKKGKGTQVQKGDTVMVHAIGKVTKTGKTFWSTRKTNDPFEYQAGVGDVIVGWDQGCIGMMIGEVRKIDIPAVEGYGVDGFPDWGIPKNGGINFEIEILKINGKKK